MYEREKNARTRMFALLCHLVLRYVPECDCAARYRNRITISQFGYQKRVSITLIPYTHIAHITLLNISVNRDGSLSFHPSHSDKNKTRTHTNERLRHFLSVCVRERIWSELTLFGIKNSPHLIRCSFALFWLLLAWFPNNSLALPYKRIQRRKNSAPDWARQR